MTRLVDRQKDTGRTVTLEWVSRDEICSGDQIMVGKLDTVLGAAAWDESEIHLKGDTDAGFPGCTFRLPEAVARVLSSSGRERGTDA